jgi:hypothetical protein
MESHRKLYERIMKCWGSDTSSDPTGWSPINPAWGQCAVTACIVQDFLGGVIVWAKAVSPDKLEHSHYFNVLSDGSIVDMTREQFPSGTLFVPEFGCERTQNGSAKAFANTREYVLSYPATLDRYTILRRRLESLEESPGLFQSKGSEKPRCETAHGGDNS